MKKRCFTDLKKTMSLQELNRFCKKVAEEYARSETHFAQKYFCKNYNISSSCFYKVIEYAIVRNLVSDHDVQRMENKALINQKAHCKDAGRTTQEKYDLLWDQRQKFCSGLMSNSDVFDFATLYADNPDISKEKLATSFGITARVADLILVRGIVENIVPDKVVDAIEERCIKNAKPEKKDYTKRFFVKIRHQRKEYAKKMEAAQK